MAGEAMQAVFRESDPVIAREAYHVAIDEIGSSAPLLQNCWKKLRQMRLPIWTFPSSTDAACVPTTCRSEPTARSSAAAAWCRCSHR